jgi:hypothetical protein
MTKIVYRLTKIYADGHLWTENADSMPSNLEKLYLEDPSLVAIIITRNILRRE